jgi:hypothetical protein
MLSREIVAVCSKIHTKTQKYGVYWVQNIQFLMLNLAVRNSHHWALESHVLL